MMEVCQCYAVEVFERDAFPGAFLLRFWKKNSFEYSTDIWYMCLYIYIYIWIYIDICLYVYIYNINYLNMYVYIYIRWICLHVQIYVVHVYIYIYILIYVYVFSSCPHNPSFPGSLFSQGSFSWGLKPQPTKYQVAIGVIVVWWDFTRWAPPTIVTNGVSSPL